MSLVVCRGVTNGHYYVSCLVVCRGSQSDTIMSLVVCKWVTKRYYYVSSCLQEGSQRDTIMSLLQTTRDIIVSLCDPSYKQLET
jgi:hypothetical protein